MGLHLATLSQHQASLPQVQVRTNHSYSPSCFCQSQLGGNQFNPNQFNPNQFNQFNPNQSNQFNQFNPNQSNQSNPTSFNQSNPNQPNPNQFDQSTPNRFNQSIPTQFNQSTLNQFNPSALSLPFSFPVPNTSSASLAILLEKKHSLDFKEILARKPLNAQHGYHCILQLVKNKSKPALK